MVTARVRDLAARASQPAQSERAEGGIGPPSASATATRRPTVSNLANIAMYVSCMHIICIQYNPENLNPIP